MKKFVIALLLVAIATPAMALTLAEKKKYAAWQEELAEASKEFKDKCGYDLPVTLSEDITTPFMEANRSASGFCESVISAMSYMCEDEISKTAITEKVKSLSCEYKKGETKGVWSLDEGKLTFGFDIDVANISDETKTWLENNL